MVRYVFWALAELCAYVIIALGLLCVAIPAVLLMLGYGVQGYFENKRLDTRKQLGIRWRERNRASGQALCGKRPS